MPGAILSIPYSDWPAADRAAWEAACADGDVFDRGAASHLRRESRLTLTRGYACWLSFLQRTEPAALLEPPAQRISATRVKLYAEERSNGRQPATVWNSIKALYDVARFIAPAEDWVWLKRAKAGLERQLRPRRPPTEDSARLQALGAQLMDEAWADGEQLDAAAALTYRDGFAIALLASRPLRRLTMSLMRIGQHLQRAGEGWTLVLPREDMKNDRDTEYSVPAWLLPYLERYVAAVRPRIPGAALHDGLWPSRKGGAMSADALYKMVCRRTLSAFGVAITPHAFRHSSATTIAIHAPEMIGAVPGLLGHADPRASERYYNMAQSLEVGRQHGSALEALYLRLQGCEVRTRARPKTC